MEALTLRPYFLPSSVWCAQEGDVPRYVRGTPAPLDAAAAERAAADTAAGAGAAVGREAPSCFNCGSYGHAIKVGPR